MFPQVFSILFFRFVKSTSQFDMSFNLLLLEIDMTLNFGGLPSDVHEVISKGSHRQRKWFGEREGAG